MYEERLGAAQIPLGKIHIIIVHQPVRTNFRTEISLPSENVLQYVYDDVSHEFACLEVPPLHRVRLSLGVGSRSLLMSIRALQDVYHPFK